MELLSQSHVIENSLPPVRVFLITNARLGPGDNAPKIQMLTSASQAEKSMTVSKKLDDHFNSTQSINFNE